MIAITQSAGTYAFKNEREIQQDRLRALETLLDPGTIRHLEALGAQPGWDCLEVGAGGGSIAGWLCDRVGPQGRVLATDLDTTVLSRMSRPNLEIGRHDVQRDELPAGRFDLVHLRLVLAWLSDRATALRRMVAALKPGGWLVAEEMDFVSVAADPRVDRAVTESFARVVAAHKAVLSARHSFDPEYGRRVAGDLAAAGLAELGTEGRCAMWHGGGAGGTVYRITFEQLREPMLASGIATPADVDAAIAACGDPGFAFLSQVTVAAWGRRSPAV